MELLYERGSFLPGDTLKTSQVVLVYALALFTYSAVKILVPAFYALNDTRTPVRISFLTVGAKIFLNLLLVYHLGFLGLAMATTIASWLNLGLLIRQMKQRAGFAWRKNQLDIYVRIMIASLAMGLLALSVFRASGGLWPDSTHFMLAIRLGFAILVGMGSLIPLLRMLRVEEGSEIIRMMRLMVKRAS